MHYKDNAEDPNLVGDGGVRAHLCKLAMLTCGHQDDDSEEIEDLTIRPTDLLIISVANEEDYNHLDVCTIFFFFFFFLYLFSFSSLCVLIAADVYDEKADNLYIHHDIILPESPLCVSWLDYNAQQPPERGKEITSVCISRLLRR